MGRTSAGQPVRRGFCFPIPQPHGEKATGQTHTAVLAHVLERSTCNTDPRQGFKPPSAAPEQQSTSGRSLNTFQGSPKCPPPAAPITSHPPQRQQAAGSGARAEHSGAHPSLQARPRAPVPVSAIPSAAPLSVPTVAQRPLTASRYSPARARAPPSGREAAERHFGAEGRGRYPPS